MQEINSAPEENQILDLEFDFSGNDQGAISYVQIAGLVIFLASLVFYLILLKKYIVKFIGFYVVRKDFQSLYLLDMNLVQKGDLTNRAEHTDLEMGSFQDREKRLGFTGHLKQNIIQHLHIYHPFVGVLFRKCCLLSAIKLPFNMSLWLALGCLYLSLSVSLIIVQLLQSLCLDKRFYAENLTLCQEEEPELMGLMTIILIAIAVAIVSLPVSLLVIKMMSKDYVLFLEGFVESNQKNNESPNIIQSRPINPNLVNNNSQSPSSQLNKEEGDDSKKSNMNLLSPHARGDSNTLNFPQEEIKNQADYSTFKVQHSANKNQGHIVAEYTFNSPNKDNKRDSKVGIKESSNELLGDKKNQNHDVTDQSPQRDLKFEDYTQRQSLLQGQGPFEYEFPEKKKTHCCVTLLTKLIILVVICLALLGLFLILYSLFNMTHNGLLQTFKVFGLALILDYLVVRLLSTLGLSIIQTILDRKNNVRNYKIRLDQNQVEALGQIYEVYKQNYQQYLPLRSFEIDDLNLSSECDSEENLIKKQEQLGRRRYSNKPTFGGLRLYKVICAPGGKNQQPREFYMVEPTFLNQVGGPEDKFNPDQDLVRKKREGQVDHPTHKMHVNLENIDENKKGELLPVEDFDGKKSSQKKKDPSPIVQGQLQYNNITADNLDKNGRQTQNDGSSLVQSSTKQNINLPSISPEKRGLQHINNDQIQQDSNTKNKNAQDQPVNRIHYDASSMNTFVSPSKNTNHLEPLGRSKLKDNSLNDDDFIRGRQLFQGQDPSQNQGFEKEPHPLLNQPKNKIASGKVMLPNGSALFNIPFLSKIWGNNKKKNTDGLGDPNYKKTLGEIVNSSGSQYFNLPLIVDDAENKLNQLINNDENLFKKGKKNSNEHQILMVDTTLYNDLPFRHIPQKDRELEQQLKQKRAKKNQGEKTNIISSSNYVAPMPMADPKAGPDAGLSFEDEKKKKRNGEIVEIDSTMLYSLPMFQKGAKLSPLEKDVKQQLEKLLPKKRQGETIEIDSKKFYDLRILKLTDNLSEEQQKLKDQIEKCIKRNGEVVEIDSTYIFSFPLFKKNDKDGEDARNQILSLFNNRQPRTGEVIQVDSTKFFNLPMFQTMSPEAKQVYDHIQSQKKKGNTGEVVEIDSTYIFSLPIFKQNTPEAEEARQQILQFFNNRQPRTGEVVQVDSTQFFQLPIFQKMTPEVRQLFEQMQKAKKKRTGEVVEIDSTYIFSLPLFKQNTPEAEEAKQQLLSFFGGKLPRTGEVVEVDSTRFFTLPMFVKGPEEQSQDLKQLTDHLQKQKKQRTGEIVEVDSTMLVNLPYFKMNQNNQEVQDLKNKIYNILGIKQVRSGEKLEITSSQLYDLTNVLIKQQQEENQNKEQVEEFQKQLFSAIKRRVNGEVVPVDATFFCDFSNVGIFKPQVVEEEQDPAKQSPLPKKKKRKTNRGEIMGVDALIHFDANTNAVQQITQERQPTIEDQKEQVPPSLFNQQIIEENQEEKDNSFHLPQIKMRPQPFETPKEAMQPAKWLEENSFKEGISQANDTSNLNDLIEKKETMKSYEHHTPVQKEQEEGKTNLNTLELPKNEVSFQPEYVSNKKKKTSSKKKKRMEAFQDENNENVNNSNLMNNSMNKYEEEKMTKDASPLQQLTDLPPVQVYQNQDANQSMESHTKTKMDLQDFIKPKIYQKKRIRNNNQSSTSNNNTMMKKQNDLDASDQEKSYVSNNLQNDSDSNLQNQLNFLNKVDLPHDSSIDSKEKSGPLSFYNLGIKKKVKKSPSPPQDLDTAIPEQKSSAKKSKKNSSNKNSRQQLLILETENEQAFETEEQFVSNPDDLNKNELEDSINNMKLNKRKPARRQGSRQGSRQKARDSSGSDREGTGNQQISMNTQIRLQQEKQEQMKRRVQEQRKQLNNFLQMARDNRSQGDEEKIKQMIEQLNQTKKPLPMNKVNELKSLEMINSPYSQPLMAMIKDEADFHKKKRMEAVNNAAKSRSSTRAAADNHTQKYIQQIGGIYGPPKIRKNSMRSSSSNNSQSSKSKDPSMEVMEIKGSRRNQVKPQ